MSSTIDAGADIGDTPFDTARRMSPTITMHGDEGGSPRSGKDDVLPSIPFNTIQPDCSEQQDKHFKQLVQTVTLEDLNPHGLYPNPTRPLSSQPIPVIYDTGASTTMLPGIYKDSWRNLRLSNMVISGCFSEEGTLNEVWVGEFHALLQLDDGEQIRVIIPEAVALPEEHTSYLFCDSQFLLAENTYHSDLRKPKIEFKQGGIHTMNVIMAHKIIDLLPISAHIHITHRIVMVHLPHKYDPPTFTNHATTRRPDVKTPTAFLWHVRLACTCKEAMQRT